MGFKPADATYSGTFGVEKAVRRTGDGRGRGAAIVHKQSSLARARHETGWVVDGGPRRGKICSWTTAFIDLFSLVLSLSLSFSPSFFFFRFLLLHDRDGLAFVSCPLPSRRTEVSSLWQASTTTVMAGGFFFLSLLLLRSSRCFPSRPLSSSWFFAGWPLWMELWHILSSSLCCCYGRKPRVLTSLACAPPSPPSFVALFGSTEVRFAEGEEGVVCRSAPEASMDDERSSGLVGFQVGGEVVMMMMTST